MSLLTSTNKVQYALGASPPATFPIPFAYWNNGEIHTIITTPAGDIELAEGVDFSLTLPPVASGTLTRLVSWDASATRLTIYREVEQVQETDLVNGAAYDAEVAETMADRQVAMIQQLTELVSRIVRFPVSDTTTSPDLPAAGARAGLLLGFDFIGNPMATPGSGSVAISPWAATLVDDLTLLAGLKTLGLLSAGAAAVPGPLDSILTSYPSGAFARAALTPAPNLNTVVESGFYLWTNAGTTNYPGSCAAADKYAMEVLGGPVGAGAIVQFLFDLTNGPSSTKFSWQRQSVDGGTTWTTWVPTGVPAVGDVYFQLPSLPDPATRYPGTTWSNISSTFAGAFFRAEGGNASAFGGGAQGYMHDSHSHGAATGGMSANDPHNHVGPQNGAGAGYTGFAYANGPLAYVGSTSVAHTHSIGADGGIENRPVNFTIRIWTRTA